MNNCTVLQQIQPPNQTESQSMCLEANVNSECNSEKSLKYLEVRQWIQQYDSENSTNLEDIFDSGRVQRSEKNALVRKVVSKINEMSKNAYPSTQLKLLAAKSIIYHFPKLKSSIQENGYELYYGFIQNRLKTMRTSLSPSKKRRNSKKLKPISKKPCVNEPNNTLSQEEFDSKVTTLSYMMPNDTNKPTIVQLMDETRGLRQQLITSTPISLNEILIRFPKFKDYSGEFILREFQKVYISEENFLGNFPSFYSSRILKLCSIQKPHIMNMVKDFPDDNMKSVVVLPHLLPSPNYYTKTTDPSKLKNKQKKKQKTSECTLNKVPNPHLLQFVQASNNLIQATSDTCANQPIQPFLICATNGPQRTGVFYIKADNHIFPVGENFLVAFDILLKLHFSFDLQYARDLENFYNFLQTCIMGHKVSEVRDCCAQLNETLLNMEPDTINTESNDNASEYDDN